MTAYGIWIALAMGVFFILFKWRASVDALPKGTAEVYAVLAVPFALLCARLVFCLADAGYFLSTITQADKMLFFFDGGYAMTGVLIGFTVSGILTAKIMRAPYGRVLDAAAAALGVPLCMARLAEAETALGRGREIISEALRGSVFFTVPDYGALRHAVYRYEAVAAAVLFGVMLFILHKKWQAGDKALLFIILYGAAQVVLESMRDDFHMLWGFVRAQQIFAIFLPVTAAVIFSVRMYRSGTAVRVLIPIWLLGAAGIILGVIKEFDIDTSLNLFIDYGLMVLAVAALAGAAVLLMIGSHRAAASDKREGAALNG
jgi:prolipoprotein diacylglyceryltransferase